MRATPKVPHHEKSMGLDRFELSTPRLSSLGRRDYVEENSEIATQKCTAIHCNSQGWYHTEGPHLVGRGTWCASTNADLLTSNKSNARHTQVMNNTSFKVEVSNLAVELHAAIVTLEAERDRLKASGEHSVKLEDWIARCEQAKYCCREVAYALREATTEERVQQIRMAYEMAKPALKELAIELASLPIFRVTQ